MESLFEPLLQSPPWGLFIHARRLFMDLNAPTTTTYSGIFFFVLDLVAFRRYRLPQTPLGFGLLPGPASCHHLLDPIGLAMQDLSMSCPPVASSSAKPTSTITHATIIGDQAPNSSKHAPLRLLPRANSQSPGAPYTRAATMNPKIWV
jgi:hypothetical protein